MKPEEARIAATESADRKANASIAELADFFSSDETEFLCECADADCREHVEAPRAGRG